MISAQCLGRVLIDSIVVRFQALGREASYVRLGALSGFPKGPTIFRASECSLSGAKRTLWRRPLDVRLWPEADIGAYGSQRHLRRQRPCQQRQYEAENAHYRPL